MCLSVFLSCFRRLQQIGGMQPGKRLTWSKYTGMVFNYLNNPTVWTKFCDTYEGIYHLMAQFDVWYAVSDLSLCFFL